MKKYLALWTRVRVSRRCRSVSAVFPRMDQIYCAYRGRGVEEKARQALVDAAIVQGAGKVRAGRRWRWREGGSGGEKGKVDEEKKKSSHE